MLDQVDLADSIARYHFLMLILAKQVDEFEENIEIVVQIPFVLLRL